MLDFLSFLFVSYFQVRSRRTWLPENTNRYRPKLGYTIARSLELRNQEKASTVVYKTFRKTPPYCRQTNTEPSSPIPIRANKRPKFPPSTGYKKAAQCLPSKLWFQRRCSGENQEYPKHKVKRVSMMSIPR